MDLVLLAALIVLFVLTPVWVWWGTRFIEDRFGRYGWEITVMTVNVDDESGVEHGKGFTKGRKKALIAMGTWMTLINDRYDGADNVFVEHRDVWRL